MLTTILLLLLSVALFHVSSTTPFQVRTLQSVDRCAHQSIPYTYGNTQLQWGPIGHSLSAYIAESLLSVSALNHTRLILGADVSLSSISSWADAIREHSEWHWTERLHYINTPDWSCDGYIAERDCGDKQCVDAAIQNYTKQLQQYSNYFHVDDSIVNAYKFIVHFMGDVHQPLHVGFTSDEGGNTICGHFDGAHDKLHAVWDTKILARRIKADYNHDEAVYAQDLLDRITAGMYTDQLTDWLTCTGNSKQSSICSAEWASESSKLACTHAYVLQDGHTHIENNYSLNDEWYQRNLPIVEQQIAKAGVRLAALLNTVFQEKTVIQ